MPDIKTKELKDKTIKDLDKSVVWTERIKNPIINTKDNQRIQNIKECYLWVLICT